MTEKTFAEKAAEAKARNAARLALESANGELKKEPAQVEEYPQQEQINLLQEMYDDAAPFTEWELSFMKSVLGWLRSKPEARMSEKQIAVYEKLKEKYEEYYS